MTAAPWDRNAGRFDRPSSAVPAKASAADFDRVAPQVLNLSRSRPAALDQRVAEARRQGVSPVNADTILQRIDDALQAARAKGYGDMRSIYLTDADLLAFRKASPGASEYRDMPVHSGAESFVYGGRGRVRICKRPKVAQ